MINCRRLTNFLIKANLQSSKRFETNQTNENLRSEVIKLYKNLIYLSKDWHTDLRPQIKRGFMKNKDVKDAEEIRKLIAKGEYISREITATYHLKKYRTMKRRYYREEDGQANDLKLAELTKGLT